jgi:hypothetical protein
MSNSFSDLKNAKKIIIIRRKTPKQRGQKTYTLSPLFLEIKDDKGNAKVIIENRHNK